MSGQSFLLGKNQDFILKLRAIKSHMDSPINPIHILICEFHSVFIDQNRLLLYERDINDPNQPLVGFDKISREVQRCVVSVKEFRQIIQDAVVRFYQLEFRGMNDVNIELLQNMLTSFVIRDDLYIFLQCLYTIQYQQEIQAL